MSNDEKTLDEVETTADTSAGNTALDETKNTEKEEKAVDDNASMSVEQEKPNESDKQDNINPFEAEIDRLENKKAEETKTGLLNKLPVFEYAGVSEEIADLTKTFEDIRISKAEDFPELEDGNRVSWKMSYCGIVKNIALPKKTTIADQKKLIEESKDFATAIKRKKGDFVCKVIPTVTAQKKGRIIDSTAESNYTIVTDEVGIKYKNVYDGLGRIKEKYRLNGTSWNKLETYTYDNVGRLTQKTSGQIGAGAIKEVYTYDALNRVYIDRSWDWIQV